MQIKGTRLAGTGSSFELTGQITVAQWSCPCLATTTC